MGPACLIALPHMGDGFCRARRSGGPWGLRRPRPRRGVICDGFARRPLRLSGVWRNTRDQGILTQENRNGRDSTCLRRTRLQVLRQRTSAFEPVTRPVLPRVGELVAHSFFGAMMHCAKCGGPAVKDYGESRGGRSNRQRYRVLVDDNFRYGREDERYEAGSFDTYDDAVAKCTKIVEDVSPNRGNPA